jgi:hypothetical protein
MSDLVAFLRARLDEDEAAARASGGLKQGDYHWFETDPVRPPPGVIGTNSGNIVTYQTELREHAAHIARHDPERVLREVGAKRAILNAHRITDGRCHVCTAIADGRATRFPAPCPTLYFLAAVYSDHPDYHQMEWERP